MNKPKLVPDAKKSWRWFSMQAMTLNLGVLTTWSALPEDLKSTIPESWVLGIAIVVTLAGIIGRLVDQPEAQ